VKNDVKKLVPLAGYSDRLSARPGQTIEFKVSSQTGKPVEAWLTRSISADPNPEGVGIVELNADKFFHPIQFFGHFQEHHPGSFGVSVAEHLFDLSDGFQLGATIFPTIEKDCPQTILSFGGVSLRHVSKGLELRLGDAVYSSDKPLHLHKWQRIKVAYNAQTGQIELFQYLEERCISEYTFIMEDKDVSFILKENIYLAAEKIDDVIGNYFNGKIEKPYLKIGTRADRVFWDLSQNISSTICLSSTGDHNLKLVNFPARAMTGSTWDSSEMAWKHAPDQYGAIYFHETDIYDFEWKTDFSFDVPDDCPSGVYIMHMRSGDHEDTLPIYICAPFREPTAKLCVLISTFTYLIYGNHARPDYDVCWKKRMDEWNAYPHNPAEYPSYGLSTYNVHSDNSGICHASHLRPLFNFRPGFLTFGTGKGSGLRHMQADSHLISWLHHKGIEFDVITDQELHDEGVASIREYECVMTGSHPEYHTVETLDALQEYRDNGGNFIYLGGNGFYWKIVSHPEHPGIFEIRRAEDGIRAWAAETGEYYHAFDGSYGGLWRRNGRPPQMLAGIGFSAQGEFHGSFYRRKCYDPESDWIFEGIDDDIIGDFGFSGGGAAGFELDRVETRLGTPENAIVLGSSEGHDDGFMLVPEEQLTHLTTWSGKPAHELIRADIIYCDLPGGGSLFSTGSITFCGSLPWNDYDNNVSKMLENVVRKMTI
jgi:N,N-dimethylformamidase